MKFKKKAVLLGVIIVLALFLASPAGRDELDWRWTISRDQAADYAQYYTDWPKGRHLAEAHLRYEQRNWSDTKRAMIAEATKNYTADPANPEARKERRAQQEHFFWREVTNRNTATSYNDYLERYPAGEFAAQARRQITDLSHPGANDHIKTNPPDQ